MAAGEVENKIATILGFQFVGFAVLTIWDERKSKEFERCYINFVWSINAQNECRFTVVFYFVMFCYRSSYSNSSMSMDFESCNYDLEICFWRV